MKDVDGGERNGGGNGRGVRLANRPMPVSNRKGKTGGLCESGVAAEANHLSQHGRHVVVCTRRRTVSHGRKVVGRAARVEDGGLGIPAVKARRSPVELLAATYDGIAALLSAREMTTDR